jgi:hypothetical protein
MDEDSHLEADYEDRMSMSYADEYDDYDSDDYAAGDFEIEGDDESDPRDNGEDDWEPREDSYSRWY